MCSDDEISITVKDIQLYTLEFALALEHSRPWRSISLRPRVKIEQNPRIRRLIRTRQAHTARSLASATTLDVDLRTLHVELRTLAARSAMQSDELTTEQVLSWRNALWDGDGLDTSVGDEAVYTPFAAAVEAVFGDLEPAGYTRSADVSPLNSLRVGGRVYVQPTPESVFASLTFFRYAMTGPLWLASMTSPDPDVSVWRQVSFAVEPACTLMTVDVDWVGLGPPLHAMSLEVTSVIGWYVLVPIAEWGDMTLTPSYDGTRIPSPTAPPFSETKMVCADAVEAAAIVRPVESFIVTSRMLKD
jgi:hypothetical protein